MVHGDQEKFSFNSKPTNATLRIDGRDAGSTPAVVNLTRKNGHSIEIMLSQYKPETIYLQKTVSGWLFGNILLIGGIIGIAVDAMDGAMYKLTPQEVSSYASQSNIKYDKNKHSFMIILVKSPQQNWEKIGQLKK